MGEMPRVAPHLPEPVIGLGPFPLQVLQKQLLQVPDGLLVVHPHPPGHIDRVHQLPVDVDLDLLVSGVASANRPGAFVTGEPVQLQFGHATLAGHPVHDLEVLRVARYRPEQPVPPREGLTMVSGHQQRLQSESGVTQPDEPVIPIAHPANLLGKRCGWGGDDAAGWGIGKGLECD